MTDPREDLPSASSMPRYFLCGGSYLAEKSVPAREKNVDTDETDTGKKRHKLINTDDVEEFDDQGDEYTVTRAKELREEAMQNCGISMESNVTEIKDKRLWLRDDKLNKIFSGEFDILWISKDMDMALIFDDKTLWGDHGEAKTNEQLISYAVLVHEVYGINNIYLGLGQPNLSRDKQLTMCRFNIEDLDKAVVRLHAKLEEIKQPGLPRTPNPHCDYCAFYTRCPEVLAQTYLAATEPINALVPTTTAKLDRIKLAKKLLLRLEDNENRKALAQLTFDPDSIPGYKIAKGRRTVSIDAGKAWPVLNDKLDGQTFADACDLKITKLVKPYQEKYELSSLKIAREKLEGLLEDNDAIEYHTGSEHVKKG